MCKPDEERRYLRTRAPHMFCRCAPVRLRLHASFLRVCQPSSLLGGSQVRKQPADVENSLSPDQYPVVLPYLNSKTHLFIGFSCCLYSLLLFFFLMCLLFIGLKPLLLLRNKEQVVLFFCLFASFFFFFCILCLNKRTASGSTALGPK